MQEVTLSLRPFMVFLCLTLLGILGNVLNIPMFFGVDLILGSIFVLITAYLFGPWAALLSALIVHSYTIFLWGHPYAYIGFSIEAIAVGYLIRLRKINIFVADQIFWICIGMPLAWFFYSKVMGMEYNQAFLIILKQPANGILNALIATLLATLLPLERWAGTERSQKKSIAFQELLLVVIMSFVFFASFIIAITNSYLVFNNTVKNIAEDLTNATNHVDMEFAVWSKSLTKQLLMFTNKAAIRETDFSLVYQIDDSGVRSLLYKQPNLSVDSVAVDSGCDEAFISVMEVDTKYWLMLTVAYEKGCLQGGINPSVLSAYLVDQRFKPNFQNTLVGPDDRTIASSWTGLETNVVFSEWRKGEIRSSSVDEYHLLPEDTSLPLMLRWKKSYYVHHKTLDFPKGFSLVVEAPFADYINFLQSFYIRIFTILLAVIFIALLISMMVRRYLIQSVNKLAETTSNLSDKLMDPKDIIWPESSIREIDFLTTNFRQMASVIGQAFREREENYKKLFESSINATFIVETKSATIVDVNHKAEELIGFRMEELFGMAVSIIHPPEEKDRYTKIFQQIVDRKTIADEDLYLWHRDGYQIAVELYAVEMRLKNQDVILEIFKDISEQKQAEKVLKESEERFRGLAESTSDWIWEFDENDIFTYASPGIENILGYKPEQVIGKSAFDLIPTPHREIAAKEFAPIKAARSPFASFENVNQHKNGQLVTLESSGVPIIDSEDKFCGYRGIDRDISERKMYESQLRQSHKMEAIGTLAGGVAHDFNNILAIILGYADMAIDDVPEHSPAKQKIGEVIKAGNRAKELVKHILNFSRKEALERSSTQIHLLVNETLKLLRASIPSTIEIKQNIDDHCGSILANPTQIHQVLMNICANAAQSMDENGGVLEVELNCAELSLDDLESEPGLEPGQFVRLTIRDSGIGIDQQYLDKIFDPYFTTKEVGKGSGMGLSVVIGIVKSHNGMITVDSKLGEGTTFNVYFPSIEQQSHEQVDDIEPLPMGTEKILVVDDEAGMVDLTKKRVERLGYQVTTKTSSVEALELFRSRPDEYDIVITDQTMPELTGDKLAMKLMEIRPDIPIIICTGHSARMDSEKANFIGVRAYIMKPVDKRKLAMTIRQVLDGSAESVK